MIKELIFQKQKWYQSEVPNYIGRTLKAPTQKPPFYYIYRDWEGQAAKVPIMNREDTKDDNENLLQISISDITFDSKIIGQMQDHNGDTYLLIRIRDNRIVQAWYSCWIKLDELIQNGGGTE